MKLSRLALACVFLGAAAPALAPVFAQSGEEARRLQACIEKIETDAAAAYEDGLAWVAQGNRPAAQHCTALALIALGQAEEGAYRLESLANAQNAGGLEERAIYLTQAGNAWLLADAPEAAIVTLTNAMKLRPQDASLFKDRARAHLAMESWEQAGKDLDSAIRLYSADAEALHMRAIALMKMERWKDAWDDITRAMKAAPQDVSILVTRGDLREAMRKKGLPDPEGVE
jgi:tetratricopeptide (TPR) repeat protein